MGKRRDIIAELLRRGRPDLANVVAHGRIVTADAKDLADAADRLIGPFVKTVQGRVDRIIELTEAWELKGEFNSRKIKIALTKLIQEVEKIVDLKAPSNLRPREKERFEQACKGKELEVSSLQEDHKKLGKLNHHDMKATQRFIDGLKRSVRYTAELAQMTVDSMKEWASMLVPKEFKLGKFDVIDDYGLHERTAEPWFTAVTRASQLLEKAGFGHLLYGELHLATSDEWGGMYYSKPDRVDLFLNQHSRGKPEQLIGTLVHELGHRQWYKFMEAAQRDQFSAPWIDQEEILRDLHEKMNEYLRIPKEEREEAFKLLQKTTFDYASFKRWVEEDPAKAFRWHAWLRTSYFTPALVPMTNKGELNKNDFDAASERLFGWQGRIDELSLKVSNLRPEPMTEEDRELLPPDKFESLRKHEEERIEGLKDDWLDEIESLQKSIAKFWKWVREGLVDDGPQRTSSQMSMDELREAFEPGSKKTRHPRSAQIYELLKISPIKPSITEYGQTNRKEDFAETFEEVLMGRERSHEVMVRLQRALPRAKILSQVTASGDRLYHTTSIKNLLSILREQKLKPKDTDNPFISFGERPYFGDISHNEAVLVFDRQALSDVMKVDYTESWFNQHPEQAAYIAGEGWIEQYEQPEECFEYDEDEDFEEADQECLDEAYRQAELGAFLAKSDEREWISKREHQPVKFRPEHVEGVLLKKGSVEAMERELWKLGLNHVEVRKI